MLRKRDRSERLSLSRQGSNTAPPAIAWLMSQALAHPDLISLAAGFTDNDFLPVAEARELVERIFGESERARATLQYGPGVGVTRLRELTAGRLERQDGQAPGSLDPASVLVTNGSQQLLYILTEALCDPGDLILVEDPTYFVFLSIMQSRGIAARTVPMCPDGLDLESLDRVLDRLRREGELPRLKMLYSVTYFQNPTGISTSFEKKRGTLELLRRYEADAGHPLYYVEDAAYREMSFPDSVPAASALALPEFRERIIYTGTYSKPFATGVRVGFGLLPSFLHEVAFNIKSSHDFGTAHLLQEILVEALDTGIYDRHREKISRGYALKAQAMVEAVTEWFPPEARFTRPEGGLSMWVELPQIIETGPESSFFGETMRQGVLYVPGEYAFADDPIRPCPRSSLRLAFGNTKTERIRQGIERLGAALRARC